MGSRGRGATMQGHVAYVVPILIVSTTAQLLKSFPPDFKPILSKIIAEKDKVKIAKATESLQVEGHKAIARVIKHTNTDSPVARTVIIQNSPEAHRAFGVRNVPKNILRKLQNKKGPQTAAPKLNKKPIVNFTDTVKNTQADQSVDIINNVIETKIKNLPTTTVPKLRSTLTTTHSSETAQTTFKN